MTHTPGPWTDVPSMIRIEHRISASDGRTVVQMVRPEDAPIIAAAPDMYAALKASRIYVESCDAPDVLSVLDAALLKAEGRS